jgi:hypothetical protein
VQSFGTEIIIRQAKLGKGRRVITEAEDAFGDVHASDEVVCTIGGGEGWVADWPSRAHSVLTIGEVSEAGGCECTANTQHNEAASKERTPIHDVNGSRWMMWIRTDRRDESRGVERRQVVKHSSCTPANDR